MKHIAKRVLQGLAAALPLGLTLYLIYWLLTTIERLVKPILLSLLPAHLYFPGLGVIAGLAVLFVAGFLVNAYGVRYLIQLGNRQVERIPLVKSVFGAIQDMMRVFTLSRKQEARHVVMVDIGGDSHLIGFVTGEGSGQRLFAGEGHDKVGVYLPMSYQIGGFTLYIERDRLQPLDIGFEEAMRIAITGGAQRQDHDAG